MIRGFIHHNLVFVEESSNKEENKALRKALKFYEKKFKPQAGEYPYTVIDIWVKDKRAFPTGYLDKVKKKLERKKIEFDFKDKRVYREKTFKFKQLNPFDNEPRAWQKKAVKETNNFHTGFISAPTASGKSRVINEVIINKQVKTLIIVPTQNIQTQTANKLRHLIGANNVSTKLPLQTEDELLEKEKQEKEERDKMMKENLSGKRDDGFNLEIDKDTLNDYFGVSESAEQKYLKEKGHKEIPRWQKKNKFGKKKTPSIPITVVCYKALENGSIKFLESIEMVIIDEAHHASSKTIRDALNLMSKACFRYGFSATAWRDKKHEMELLESAIGPKIIFDYNPQKALEEEVIAAPELKIIEPAAPKVFLQKHTNWRYILEHGIIGNEVRNEIIANEAIEHCGQGYNVFICVDEIAHAEILEERIKGLGGEAIVIHGQKKRSINEENIKTVGETQGGLISIGTMSVGEGTDMPHINLVILASGGKSTIRLLQRIGRGLRTPDGKTDLLVIDFFDWFNPILLRHSLARQSTFKKYYEGEG